MTAAIYREYGGKYLVNVLSDETVDEGSRRRRRVEFRLEKALIPSPLHKTPEFGARIEVNYLLGFEHYVGWTLDYLPPAEVQPVEPIYSGPSAIVRNEELGVDNV